MIPKVEEKVKILKSMTKEELAKHFKCKPEEICMGDYIARNTTDKVCPYKVIMGFANFENSEVEDLGPLTVIVGKLEKDYDTALCFGVNFANSKITSTGNLRYIYGSAGFANSKITSLGKIQFLGNNLYLDKTKIKNMGKAKELVIEGILSLNNSNLESLGNLVKVNKILLSETSNLKDFGKLKCFKSIEFNPVESKIARITNKIHEDKRIVKEIKKDCLSKKFIISSESKYWNGRISEINKDIAKLKEKLSVYQEYKELQNKFDKEFKFEDDKFIRNPNYLY